MTERTLLLRTANEGPYFILATDFPSARVFDTVSSRLACVVELPPRSRTSLAALSLTSVALGKAAPTRPTTSAAGAGGKGKNRKSSSSASATAAVAAVDVVALGARVLAAAGLSDGTVLIHDVRKDERVGHVSVSDTQHAILSMAIEDGFLVCLAANNVLHVVDISDAAALARGVVLKVRTQPDASAVALLRAGQRDKNEEPEAEEDGGRVVLHLLVAGPTYALHRLELHHHQGGHDDDDGRGTGRRNVCDKVLAFASQGTTVDYAWLGTVTTATTTTTAGAEGSIAAVTASANEGVVRVWDMTSDTSGSNANAVVGRCRRTLLCGQRIANISVLDLSQHTKATKKGSVYVLATTFTGAVLLWDLGEQILPRVVEPAPLQPSTAFFSSSPSARLLYAVLMRGAGEWGGKSDRETTTTTTAAADAELSLLLLRGKFATPQFEFTNVQRLVANQEARLVGASPSSSTEGAGGGAKQRKQLRKAASVLGLGAGASLALVEVPAAAALSSSHGKQRGGDEVGLNDAAGNAFRVLDTVWATHRQRLAKKALMTPTESFAAVHTYQAPSLKDLPVKQLTLEQRLRALSADVAKRAASRAAVELWQQQTKNRRGEASEGAETIDDEEGPAEGEADEAAMSDDAVTGAAAVGVLPSLGLATVPLYQALHANDVSAVMELLSVAARSKDGMRATVLSLQLPYVLQLVGIISERLGITSAKSSIGAATTAGVDNTKSGRVVAGGGGGLSAVSSRSPLLLWLDTIVHFRGMELYAAQLQNAEARRGGAVANEEQKRAEEDEQGPRPTETQVPMVSPPKDFLAPVLHQYRGMCSTYDKLATLHGRLSIFNAVRPSEKHQFVNRPRKMLSSNMELARTPAALSGKLNATHTVQDDDILFPAMFTELRTSKGPHVVRVRSRLAKERKHRQMVTSDRALLRRAKQLAKKERANGKGGGILSGSDADADEAAMAALGLGDEVRAGKGGGGEEDIDLEALEALGLGDTDDDDDFSGSSSGSDDGGEDEAEEEEEEERIGGSHHPHAKAARKERRNRTTTTTAEMLADAPSSDDDDSNASEDRDAELDSSDAGADFARESDDEVHSDMLDFSDDNRKTKGIDDEDDDDSSSAEDDESGSSSGSDDDDEAGDYNPVSRRFANDEDRASSDTGASDAEADGDEDDDGMEEDMRHLLEEADGGDDEDAKRERRKSKRVRTDK